MGLLKDIHNELGHMGSELASEILGKEQRIEDPAPTTLTKVQSAFISGFYSTRNIQRAQFGNAFTHAGHGFGPGLGRPYGGPAGPEM